MWACLLVRAISPQMVLKMPKGFAPEEALEEPDFSLWHVANALIPLGLVH